MSPKKLTFSAFLSFIISFKNYAFDGPPPPGLPNPPDASINDEISALMFAGLLLGCFFIYRRRKQRIQIDSVEIK